MAKAATLPRASRTSVSGRGRLRRTLRAGDRAAGIVCILALVLMAALVLGMMAGYRPLVDHSGSMRPAIGVGDLLITHEVPAARVRRGDIVSFKDPALAGRLVTHRVLAIRPAGSRLDFLTKGDANSAPESWSASPRGSVGVLLFRVAGIGRTMAWTAQPVVRTVVLALATLLLSTALLRRVWRA